ncbi:MAG TPA: flagellar hook-basal body protein [Chroococcales cyanobacterium]|jgi:flagellar basal-body rod protein FlgG
MLKGIYSAASGMNFQSKQVEVISQNLANANTTGFQKSRLIGKSFNDFLLDMDQPGAVGLGVGIDGLARNKNLGDVLITNNPLNVALRSDGYFLLRDAQGKEILTRNGNFTLNRDSHLVSQRGELVLDSERKAIKIEGDPERLSIHSDGRILNGENEVGKLMVVNPPDAAITNFPLAPAGLNAVANAVVQHKAIEESNVEIIGEMVALLDANRNYGFAQKAITTQDNILNKTANDLGRIQ